MTQTLTEDDRKFIKAMEAAVEERGERWTYPSGDDWRTGDGKMCVYAKPDGSPACLIGLALFKVDPKLMPSYEDSDSGRDMDAVSVLDRLVDGGKLNLSTRTISGAYAAQNHQDRGGTWGDALDKFKGHVDA